MDSPRTVLITETSSGIGLATAVAVAEAGYRTVAAVRDVDGAAALREAGRQAGVTLDIRPLDVTDESSVQACVDGVISTPYVPADMPRPR